MEWGTFTQAYFLERQTLAAVLLLVDASVPPQQLDLVCVNWLAEAEVSSSPCISLMAYMDPNPYCECEAEPDLQGKYNPHNHRHTEPYLLPDPVCWTTSWVRCDSPRRQLCKREKPDIASA